MSLLLFVFKALGKRLSNKEQIPSCTRKKKPPDSGSPTQKAGCSSFSLDGDLAYPFPRHSLPFAVTSPPWSLLA